MKLHEIVKIPTQADGTFKLPDGLLTHNKVMGRAEGRVVLGASFNGSGTDYFVFFNADDAGYQSYVVVQEVHLGGRDIGVTVRTWTRPDVRQKGYVSGLIKFILDHVHLSIMSDDKQTPTAQMLWTGLMKKFKVQAINVKTGKIQASTKKVYSTTTMPTNLRFFIESGTVQLGEGWVPYLTKQNAEWVDTTLLPYNYFSDGDI